MYKKVLLFALAAVLVLSCISVPAAAIDAAAQPPEINAKAAMLIELNSGEILYEKDADAKIYPASLTKIMTCLLTLENSTLGETVTISQTAFDGLGDFSSTAGLVAGESMSMENLLYSMMISSGNEACNAAAEHVFGSTDAFVAKMNERAAQLGCTGTNFANTHGLHDENHYTTARDIAIITREALKNNTFRTIVASPFYTLPATNLSGQRKLTSTNNLIIPTAGNKYYDKRVTGVKTGFTTPAGRCLVATAEESTISLLSIVCGCATRILESGDLEFASFPETKKLLDYGFANYTYQTVLTTLYPLTEISVHHSAGSDYVSLAPKAEVTALLPAGYKEEDIAISTSVINSQGVEAPVTAGQELGTVTITYRGELVAVTPLVAITGVERAAQLGDLFRPEFRGIHKWLLLIPAAVVLLALAMFIVLVLHMRKKHRLKKRYKMKQNRFTHQD